MSDSAYLIGPQVRQGAMMQIKETMMPINETIRNHPESLGGDAVGGASPRCGIEAPNPPGASRSGSHFARCLVLLTRDVSKLRQTCSYPVQFPERSRDLAA